VRGAGLDQGRACSQHDPCIRIVECLVSNLRFDGISFVPEWRKPFTLVEEGLSLVRNRGAGI